MLVNIIIIVTTLLYLLWTGFITSIDLNDFNNTVIRVVFEADEDLAVNDMSAPIAIFDDPINEAAEQAFVVQLRLISSTNPLSDLTERPASLCRIIDNDRKYHL